MPPQSPSSSDLAKKYGGMPVSEIAAKYGGVPIEESSAQTPAEPSRFATFEDAVRNQLSTQYGGRAGADLAIGALKGAARTGLGIAQLLNKGTAAIGLSTPVASEVWDAARKEFTSSSSPIQSVGQGLEQTGEFFLPGSGVTRIARAVEKLPAAVRFGTRMLAEGAAAAGVHTAQTGSTEGAATVGAVGSSGPVIGKAVSAVASKAVPALQEAAEKKVAQALGATKEKFKEIVAKRAPDILKRGLTGSREGLLEEATTNAKAAGQAVDDVLLEHGAQKLSTASVLDALEQAKSGFVTTGEMSVAEAMQTGTVNLPGATVKGNMVEYPVILDERTVDHLTKLQNTVKQLGADVPLEKLVAVRRVWDDVVERAGGFAHRSGGSAFGVPLAESTEAWAKKQGGTALRQLFADNVPDIKAVNAEYSFWADLRKVLRATQARTQPQGTGLNRVVSAGVGATIGAGSGVGPAVAGGYIAPKIYAMITSPRWRMVDAQIRYKLADALAGGIDSEIASAASKVAAALTSSSGREK